MACGLTGLADWALWSVGDWAWQTGRANGYLFRAQPNRQGGNRPTSTVKNKTTLLLQLGIQLDSAFVSVVLSRTGLGVASLTFLASFGWLRIRVANTL